MFKILCSNKFKQFIFQLCLTCMAESPPCPRSSVDKATDAIDVEWWPSDPSRRDESARSCIDSLCSPLPTGRKCKQDQQRTVVRIASRQDPPRISCTDALCAMSRATQSRSRERQDCVEELRVPGTSSTSASPQLYKQHYRIIN